MNHETTENLRREIEQLRAENARLLALSARAHSTQRSDGPRIELDVVFEGFPNILFLIDADGTYLDYRAGPSARLFVPPEQFLGRRIDQVMPADLAAIFMDGLRRTLACREPVVIDYVLPMPEGKLSFEARLVPSGASHVAILVNETTELRRAASALRDSEARLRAIVESEPECVKVVSGDGTLLEMNRAGLDMLEIESVDVAGPLMDFVDIADRPAFAELHRRVMSGEKGNLVFRAIGRRGGRRWLETTATPLRDGADRVVALLGVTRDITVQRLAESKLRSQAEIMQTIFDHIPAMIALFDPTGRLALVNREWERVLGWSTAEILAHPDLIGAMYPDSAQRSRAVEFIGDAEGRWGEFRTTTRDGRTIDTLWANVRLSDGRNVGIGQDVSTRKALESQTRQTQKLESIGRLAGGVAHDFNNLLTVILGYAEILRARLEGGDHGLADLQEIIRAGSRARDLTRQLLAFARRQVITPRVLDLNDVAAGMERMLGRVLGDHVILTTRLQEGLWPVRADRSLLEQAIMNLALNARDAMPDGGTLHLETANFEIDQAYVERNPGARLGPHVSLTISDTGNGMSPETLTHLFEPFYTTKAAGEGTGLGLATVHGIVHQSGGHIQVESRPESGSNFTIFLPRSNGTVSQAPEPVIRVSRIGSGRVLVVEDDPSVRAFTAEALRSAGFHVESCPDGASAIEHVAGCLEPIDLLITDVVMPRMNGPQLIRAIAERQPAMRVLFVSGYAREAIGELEALKPGTGFLPKPFTGDALVQRVHALLDSSP